MTSPISKPVTPADIAALAEKIHHMICDSSHLISLALTSLQNEDVMAGEPLVRSIKYFNDDIFELTQALTAAAKAAKGGAA